MKKNTQHFITATIGLVLMVFGGLMKYFMTLRPNRIMEGTAITLRAVIQSNRGLFAVIFLLLFISIVLTYYKKKYWFITTSIGLVLFYRSLWQVGSHGNYLVENLSSAARISLNSGFWLYFVGLIFFLLSSIKLDEKKSPMRQLILLACIIVLVYRLHYYHMLDSLGVIKEIISRSDQVALALGEHLKYTFFSSTLGLFIALVFSFTAYKKERLKNYIKTFNNMVQVIPTLSFLGLLMIPLTFFSNKFLFLKEWGVSGVGFFPAFIVLTLYTLLPITNSSLSGFESISEHIKNAAKSMGMKPLQVFVKVELPLALPAILSGYRIALAQTVGNTILAGLVGGGGLGSLLFLGLAQSASDLILASSILIVLISLTINNLLTFIIDQVEKG